jgi:hypothetical protein
MGAESEVEVAMFRNGAEVNVNERDLDARSSKETGVVDEETGRQEIDRVK